MNSKMNLFLTYTVCYIFDKSIYYCILFIIIVIEQVENKVYFIYPKLLAFMFPMNKEVVLHSQRGMKKTRQFSISAVPH